jgi:tellurite resistance protein TerC
MDTQTLSPVAATKRIRGKIAGSKFGQLPSLVRKIIVGVIGGTIVLIGIALIVLPGPAFVVIPIGLGILATEFVWARRVVRRGRVFVGRSWRRVRHKVKK